MAEPLDLTSRYVDAEAEAPDRGKASEIVGVHLGAADLIEDRADGLETERSEHLRHQVVERGRRTLPVE